MPDPVTLANAGGWAVAVAIGVGLAVGFVRGWFVQGAVYQREVKRGDDLTGTLKEVAQSLDALTEELRWSARDRHATAPLRRPSGSP